MTDRRIEVAMWPLVVNRKIRAPDGTGTTIGEVEIMRSTVLCDMAQHNPLEVHRRFGGK
jgi:hypothetical protein